MALTKCTECDKEISDKSKFCPHCGLPFPEHTPQEDREVFDKEEVLKEEVIPVNNQEMKPVSFWSYPAAKLLLVLVIVSLCLSIFSIYTSQNSSGLEKNVNSLDKKVQLLTLGIAASEGIVTDKAVVQKALFFSVAPGEIEGVIDIRPQPTYEYKFLGRGEFDLTDRELRSMLEELMNEVEAFVDSPSSGFTLKSSSITANNYNIAEYKDGVITLTGE